MSQRSPRQKKLFDQLWRVLVVLPVMPLIIQLLLVVLFWLCATTHALAQNNIQFDENLPYYNYGDNYKKTYCLFTYDVLGPEDDIYTCKQVRVHVVLNTNPGINDYDPTTAGRHSCWQYAYGGWYAYGGSSNWNGIILSSDVSFSLTPPQYSPAAPCIKKSEADPPQQCNININSIINGAFSNKFPLDLFTGFDAGTPAPSACPSFTVTGQTFRLCYINKLTATLKYVLLLVFIISSVLAL